ncbi:hypothetical protein C6P46_005698 [Rhodotorula mucilaginosa]|uniref:F-box domain-containing protein n=1 Tax=Rhodotorula mucilaginosa TaxID=5537 RepID=A0A9P6W076_RHOMI|nr:hypothetical protein C6P46_005698 [Rhodotorula mucilaginosa]
MSERVRYARKARARVSYAPASESSDDSDADDHEKRKAGSAGRRAGQPRKGPAVIDSDGDEASDESETPKKPRKKRPKKSTLSKKNTKQSAKKKKGGQLEGVKILPLELLGEICSHLAPVDLLSLQLVNKHFYRLITAKAFQSVWVTSRRCLGLPDVGGMTEAQYATFVFGKACQSCGVKKLSLVRHDYHLRRILCKACRHQRIVKVSRLQKDQPDLLAKLHPLTLQAVTRTAYDTRSTTKSRWLDGDEQEYVDIQDLYYTDAILRDLDDQDLDSDIAAGRDEDCDTSTPTNDRTPGSRVARKSGTRVDKLSGPTRRSRRAKKLIQLREKERASLLQNSHRLFQAHGMVDKALNWSGWYRKSEHCILRPVKAQKRPPAYRGARYRKIEARLAEEDASFKKLVGDKVQTEWEQMKPTVLKVARRALEEYAKRASWPAQREQQRRLRKRYDTFLATLDDRARPFIPLFLDFLLLPSIQALWQPGKEISDAAWEAAQPSLQEDLNDYRLETCLRVRRLIISVTQGDDGGQDEHEDEEDEVATITDKFFLRADSFVCCGFAGCPGKSRPTSYWRNGLWHQPDDPRQDWIGALPDVLAHQHKFHNSDTSLPVKGFRGADSQLQIALPLEVACGMSAILELHGLDGKPAEKRHLERGSAQTHGFEWRNSKMSRHSFNGKTAWRDLLGLIKLEGDKLRKLDLYLEPPVIEYATRRDKKLVFPVTDDEMANGDEVSLGPQHEQPDQEEA